MWQTGGFVSAASLKVSGFVLTTFSGTVGALEGAVMALAVVVAAVAGVDWEKVSVRPGHEEREWLTRVVGELSRGRGLAEEDGEGGDDSDGELVHIVGWKRRR